MTEFVIGTISLSCKLCSLSKAVFVHVRLAQLCTENGISIYMCSAVEVTWLAQNFRHNSTCVWFRTIAKKFSIGGLDIIKLSKIPLIYSVSHFNLGGLGALFGGGMNPPQPPVATGQAWLHLQWRLVVSSDQWY